MSPASSVSSSSSSGRPLVRALMIVKPYLAAFWISSALAASLSQLLLVLLLLRGGLPTLLLDRYELRLSVEVRLVDPLLALGRELVERAADCSRALRTERLETKLAVVELHARGRVCSAGPTGGPAFSLV
jgi:hypothetical protein